MGSSGYNPGISTGGFSSLPASISGSGVSGGYRPGYGGGCGGSSGFGGGCGSSYGRSGGCGSSGSSYGTMIGSLMPSTPCALSSYNMRRQTRPWVGGWGSNFQMTKPATVMSTGMVSSSIPSSSSSVSSSSSSSSSSDCGSCGK